jgi:hypothetical protein
MLQSRRPSACHKFRSPDELLNENIRLRARIEQLESLLTVSSDAEVALPDTTWRTNKALENPQPPESIVTTFEGWYLRRILENVHENVDTIPDFANDHLLSILPLRQSSLKLVHFSLESLGWVHCALSASRFSIGT